jgi:hypothetical protein
MGQAERTTQLELDLGEREQGGANTKKRRYLEATRAVLDEMRAFYLAFFLTHAAKLVERVQVISKKTGEVREAVISADKLLTWAEYQTVATREHPTPHPEWNASARFPDVPWEYRRSVIKDCIGKAKAYLTATQTWQASGKKKGKPGVPTPRNHPTLYEGTFSLTLLGVDLRASFVRLRVYTGARWEWVNYPTRYNRYFEQRRTEQEWQALSPKLVISSTGAAIPACMLSRTRPEALTARNVEGTLSWSDAFRAARTLGIQVCSTNLAIVDTTPMIVLLYYTYHFVSKK